MDDRHFARTGQATRMAGGDLVKARSSMIRAVAAATLLVGTLVAAPTAQAEEPARPAMGARDFSVARSEIVLAQRVYTVYRPANLNEVGFDLPVFTWLGGGCTAIITAGNDKVFSMLASAGYFVVAYGSPDPNRFADPTGGVEHLSAAIDWALDQNGDPRSAFFRRLDHQRVAVGGMSCGGVAAIRAGSTDARIDSVFAVSASALDVISAIEAPIAFVTGGPADIEAQSTAATYRAARAPALLVNHVVADHFLMTPIAPPIDDELAALATNWLELTLFDDLTGREFVLGQPCGICGPTWQAQSKNW